MVGAAGSLIQLRCGEQRPASGSERSRHSKAPSELLREQAPAVSMVGEYMIDCGSLGLLLATQRRTNPVVNYTEAGVGML
eukprot:1049233-Prymnesium_polylepis.2